MNKLETAIKRFELAKSQLELFCTEHNDVMQQYTVLVDLYNRALGDTKEALKGVDSDTGFRQGDFSKSKTSKTHSYNPRKLPNALLAMDGVVTKVSTTYIDELVDIGKVKAADVAAAREEKTTAGRTYAPKELKAI